ncbi:MAG TPA: hypothetical protein VKB51_07910, partial [bacterium]|nr:hypothetical protein [bacterium]
MRGMIIGLVMVMVSAVPAFAQVAAPSLLPGTARTMDPEQFNALAVPVLDRFTTSGLTFLPENPAAMQWSRHSELGLGSMSASGHFDDGLTPGDFDFSGPFAGLRWVTQYVSLGAQAMDWSGGSQATSNDKQTLRDYAGAFQVFGVLAVGASSSALNQAFHFKIGAGTDDEIDAKRDITGASLRLGGAFYLGYLSGTEKFDFRNLTSPTNDFKVNRDVQGYGVAYLGQGPNPWHLEVYRTSKDFVTDGTNFLNEEQETVGVIEARFGQLGIGLQSRNGEATRAPVSPAFKETTKSQQLTLAWVTQGNWTLTGHLERTDFKGT